MKTFLEYVAEDIIRKYGHDLSRIAIVFPNKRAALFINEHLARLAGRPLWSPSYLTISDLFRGLSKRTVADPVKLVCDLHRSFQDCTGIKESLDNFFGWGELLLSDFDDIDKNMADADKVFANLRDLHELDGIDYLTDEQRAIIRQFFSNFSEEHQTELKERFLHLWSNFAAIYHDFNHRLDEQGLAYEGALYRQVTDSLETADFPYSHYLFVGFNLLHKVEQRLFRHLRREGKASFYWDFDEYYMRDHEAGYFIAQYLDDFPNELDRHDEGIYRQFSQPKHITYIAAPTENIQARYVSSWLRAGGESQKTEGTNGVQERRLDAGKRTAILLCDEQLLPVVIHSLPDEVQRVNITTGYPLSQTPAASFIDLLFTLHTGGYRPRLLKNIRQHPYGRYIPDDMLLSFRQKNDAPKNDNQKDDSKKNDSKKNNSQTEPVLQWLLSLLRHVATAEGKSVENADATMPPSAVRVSGSSAAGVPSPLHNESLFRTYTLVNRLASLVANGDLTVDVITLQRLFRQLMQSSSVPFHGEPLEGIQVMGILESRNLDFDHILLLSCNDGNMPRGVNDSSFIPHSLRKAYGLTTVEHKTAIYAYYFHRLLQRASDITLVYNNATDEGRTGEMSRFMLQLLVEGGHPVTQLTLKAGQHTIQRQPQPVAKPPAVMKVLKERFAIQAAPSAPYTVRVPGGLAAGAGITPLQAPLLTPTAINTFRRCPLSFFYRYACGLREPDEDEPQVDDRVFGLVFHAAAKNIYYDLSLHDSRIERAQLQAILDSKTAIPKAVDDAFHEQMPTTRDYNGLMLINREVVIHYLRQLLLIDLQSAPFRILGLEYNVSCELEVGDGLFTTTLGGTVDRIDVVHLGTSEERIRIIDYKTGGGKHASLPNADAIFSGDTSQSGYYLQTFLYGSIVLQDHQLNPMGLPVSPALLYIQHSAAEDYDPTLCFGNEKITDISPWLPSFLEQLHACINGIFNADEPFQPAANEKTCRSCAYRFLCSRNQE